METGKLTIQEMDEKAIERLLKPTYQDKRKAQDATMRLFNIPYQDIKQSILDYMFQTTSNFHPLWNPERVKTLLEEELNKSIGCISDPLYRSCYIAELTDIFEEFAVWHRLTHDQFLNVHIVKGVEFFNQQSAEEQKQLVKESEEDTVLVLDALSEFSDPISKKELKSLSRKQRQTLLVKKRLFQRAVKLQKLKK